MTIRLARLPERAPVKLTISVTPRLKQSLEDYAEAYAEAYGAREEVVDLVPFMLEAFLDGDRSFRSRKRQPGS
jgi:hypothetical protein